LNQSTEALAAELAEILTRYLKTSWSQSPVIQRSISANTDMVADLQLDSFQVMEFMLEVEDHFDVAIDLESLSNTQTIQQLAEVVIAANQAPAETPNQD
jgi:acyl carrier protein